MKKSLAFYSRVLDFRVVGVPPGNDSPAFCILKRSDDELHLSSHRTREFYIDDPDGNTLRFIKR
jgi:catechol 2,3-dioxygenase-like lactoylglutathione lyase family enzyme